MKEQRVRRRVKSKCLTCSNALYDEKWGEYKCKVRKTRIRDIDKYIFCEHYKRGDVQSASTSEEGLS